MTDDAAPSRRTDDALVAGRPAVFVALLFAVGVAAHAVLPHRPVVWLGILIGILGAAGLRIGRERLASALLAAALVVAGVAAGQMAAFHYPSNHVSAFAGDDPRLAQLELLIDHPPRVLTAPFSTHHPIPPRQVASATVTAVKTWGGWVPACGEVLVQVAQPHPRLEANQTVRVTGMLQRPAAAMNPGQFDWAKYYRQQRVLASVQVGHADNIDILHSPGPTMLTALREKTRRLLADGFPAERALDHALLRALLLGDHDPQLRDVQEQFQRTGTSHHLAISGMHVAVLGGFVFGICRLLCLSPRTSVVAVTAFVILYGLVALPSPPVVRSVLLCVAFGAGVASRRAVDALQLLALSVLAMLVYDPLDLYNAGFQLSFGTVLGLILFTKPVLAAMSWTSDRDQAIADSLRPKSTWRAAWEALNRALTAALAAGFVAWGVSAPLIAYHFEQLNPWAIFAGIVLAPIVFVALVCGLLKVVLTLLWPSAAPVWASVAAAPVAGMRHTVDWLAALPLGDVPVPAPPLLLIALFYLLLLPMLAPCPQAGLRWCLRGGRAVAFGLILLLPFQVGLTGRQSGPGETRVTLLSVGAGQCAVIEPPSGRVVLLDVGSTHLADLVPKCLGPYLRSRGRTSVDTVVLSHPNYDHYSAAEDVVQAYGVREVLTSAHFRRHSTGSSSAEHLLTSLSEFHRPPREIHPGERIPLGQDTTLEVLWPPADLPPSLEANNASLVLRLTHAGRSILFTGDIQDDAMAPLLSHPEQLHADVLVAPHHGSSEPLTARFIEAIHPTTILSSNDRSLTFKQRRLDALLTSQSIPLLRTSRCGAVTITFGPGGEMLVEPFLPSRAQLTASGPSRGP
jgi:competence protein ComEC